MLKSLSHWIFTVGLARDLFKRQLFGGAGNGEIWIKGYKVADMLDE
jgi:hypothetical protein